MTRMVEEQTLPQPRIQSRLPLIALAATLLVVVSPRSAAAQRDPAGGEWLFREGRALMKKGDFLGACAKLEESLRMDPAVGTLMNLAECEERLGRTASAWQRWGAAADQLPSQDRRRDTALERARMLEKSLARLAVKLGSTAPTNARVERDGVELGEPSLGVPLPVDPGIHWIVVTAPGREGREVEVRLDAGDRRVVEVEPGAPTPNPRTAPRLVAAELIPPLPIVIERPTPPAPPRRLRTTALGYGLVAGGMASLATAGYFAVQALSARREARDACPEVAGIRRCWSSAAAALDRDRRSSLFADVGLTVGALATATGLYLLLRRPSATTSTVVPVAGGGRVDVAGTF
jgi:hypothetical protein